VGGRSRVQPEYLFIGWVIFIPTFLFQTSLTVRILQTIVLVFIYIFTGRKFRIIPNALLFFSVTAAHLFQPIGMVITTIGGLSITMGALTSGVSRSLLLIGLIYISRISVSPHLNLPGRFGHLLGSVFFYFETITTVRKGRKTDYSIFMRPDTTTLRHTQCVEKSITGGKEVKLKAKISLFTMFVSFMDEILFLSDHALTGKQSSPTTIVYGGNRMFWLFMAPFLMSNYTLLILNYLKYL